MSQSGVIQEANSDTGAATAPAPRLVTHILDGVDSHTSLFRLAAAQNRLALWIDKLPSTRVKVTSITAQLTLATGEVLNTHLEEENGNLEWTGDSIVLAFDFEHKYQGYMIRNAFAIIIHCNDAANCPQIVPDDLYPVPRVVMRGQFDSEMKKNGDKSITWLMQVGWAFTIACADTKRYYFINTSGGDFSWKSLVLHTSNAKSTSFTGNTLAAGGYLYQSETPDIGIDINFQVDFQLPELVPSISSTGNWQ